MSSQPGVWAAASRGEENNCRTLYGTQSVSPYKRQRTGLSSSSLSAAMLSTKIATKIQGHRVYHSAIQLGRRTWEAGAERGTLQRQTHTQRAGTEVWRTEEFPTNLSTRADLCRQGPAAAEGRTLRIQLADWLRFQLLVWLNQTELLPISHIFRYQSVLLFFPILSCSWCLWRIRGTAFWQRQRCPKEDVGDALPLTSIAWKGSRVRHREQMDCPLLLL